VAVTVLKQSGDPQLAEALRNLSEAIIASNEIQTDAKNQALEILSVLSTEATAPKERRHNTVVAALTSRLQELLGVAQGLTVLWAQWGPVIMSAFN
jgi:hypothetical protein